MQLHSKQIAKWPTGRRERGERAKEIRLSRNEKKYFIQLYAHFLAKVLLGKPDKRLPTHTIFLVELLLCFQFQIPHELVKLYFDLNSWQVVEGTTLCFGI